MNRAKIFVSRRAEADFERIWHYIARDNEKAADRLLSAIETKIERLGAFPEVGSLREDIRPGMRSLVHGAYLVLYEYDATAGEVDIMRVVEAMRDLDTLF